MLRAIHVSKGLPKVIIVSILPIASSYCPHLSNLIGYNGARLHVLIPSGESYDTWFFLKKKKQKEKKKKKTSYQPIYKSTNVTITERKKSLEN